MTFCLGMKTIDGLVAIADTRITSGIEHRTSRKLTIHHHAGFPVFLMTSGLRSARDKVVTYFDEWLRGSHPACARLYELVNAYCQQVRRVAEEDRFYLENSGLRFDLFSLIGGQLGEDGEHKLFLVYPQGNWVEIGESSPYAIIGNAYNGKPVLDRLLDYGCSLDAALKAGVLAFDFTRTSATDVDYPIDVALLANGSRHIVEHRYTAADLNGYAEWWNAALRKTVTEAPSDWTADIPHPARPEAKGTEHHAATGD